jgi:hypothetical protein
MEGSRSIGPTYTNSTGGPIMVGISYTCDQGYTVQGLIIAGEVVYAAGQELGYASGFALIVQSGATYAFYTNGGTCTIVTWRELRP